MSSTNIKDQWSPEAYSTSASFVPHLTQTLLRYLSPQPTDYILDIGCGDGKFTASFMSAVASVLGVDSSPSMIEGAVKGFGGRNATFRVVDCRFLNSDEGILGSGWDKVISNAALHWILRDGSTRMNTLRAIHTCLNYNGTFVFEMGGHGNVAETMTALISTLTQHGIPLEKAKEANPWFFPSESWMRTTLESIGFHVEKIETEYRPTKLTDNAAGGLEGWIRLMGKQFLNVLPVEERERAVKDTCDVLGPVVTREEDGSQWLGYVRLRGVARKI